jgi:hypothetical protein
MYMGSRATAPPFLTVALDGSELSYPCPGCFTPVKELRYPLDRRLGGPWGWSGHLGIEKPYPCCESNIGHPASILSLYQLKYPVSLIITIILIKRWWWWWWYSVVWTFGFGSDQVTNSVELAHSLEASSRSAAQFPDFYQIHYILIYVYTEPPRVKRISHVKGLLNLAVYAALV